MGNIRGMLSLVVWAMPRTLWLSMKRLGRRGWAAVETKILVRANE